MLGEGVRERGRGGWPGARGEERKRGEGRKEKKEKKRGEGRKKRKYEKGIKKKKMGKKGKREGKRE